MAAFLSLSYGCDPSPTLLLLLLPPLLPAPLPPPAPRPSFPTPALWRVESMTLMVGPALDLLLSTSWCLWSFTMIRDGPIRKSRRELMVAWATVGNFSARVPKPWNIEYWNPHSFPRDKHWIEFSKHAKWREEGLSQFLFTLLFKKNLQYILFSTSIYVYYQIFLMFFIIIE